MKTRTLNTVLAMVAFAMGACGDDGSAAGGADGGTGGTGALGSGAASSSGDAGGGGAGGGGSSSSGGGGAGGGAATTVELLTSFDAVAFELPEGLAVRDDKLVVGFAFNSKVEQFELDGAARSPLASLPLPAPNTGFLTGLTSDSAGAVYAALVSFTGDPAPGVYRIPAGGGEPTLFASSPELIFPNGFAWDEAGSLFVTDSATAKVFRVAPSGAVEVWSSDALLAGDPTLCGGQPEDISVGANGIVWTPEAVFVASSDQALIVRIPILEDGSAGLAEEFTTPDCAQLAGIDGLTLDADGSLVGAVNRADRLVRIDAQGEVEVLFEGAPLDFPASLAFHGAGEERALYVTNFALNRALAGQPASPALLRVRL